MRLLETELLRLFGYGVAYVAGTAALMTLYSLLHFESAEPLLLTPAWAILCARAAIRRHLFTWTVTCLTPLALLSLAWLGRSAEDPFGMNWGIIQLFVCASMVTAATGILTLIERPRASHRIRFQGLKNA